MSKSQRRWSREEDEVLRQEARRQTEDFGDVKDWNEIAKQIPGRSNKDCRKRFCNEVTGGLKKGSWSKEEDSALEILVKRHGPSWAVIAHHFGNRSADQCSKRWNHYLDPVLDHSPWTEDEHRTLLNAVQTHGTAWKDIQQLHFPSRSANNVKNTYTMTKHKTFDSPPNNAPCCKTDSISSIGASDQDNSFLGSDFDDLPNVDLDFGSENIRDFYDDADQLMDLSEATTSLPFAQMGQHSRPQTSSSQGHPGQRPLSAVNALQDPEDRDSLNEQSTAPFTLEDPHNGSLSLLPGMPYTGALLASLGTSADSTLASTIGPGRQTKMIFTDLHPEVLVAVLEILVKSNSKMRLEIE